jgi:hypothetical protein
MRSALAACLVALIGCASVPTGGASAEPRDGTSLLARMHERYAGKWFRTLTFVQRTTQRRPDGTSQVTTWYEAQRGVRGAQLARACCLSGIAAPLAVSAPLLVAPALTRGEPRETTRESLATRKGSSSRNAPGLAMPSTGTLAAGRAHARREGTRSSPR